MNREKETEFSRIHWIVWALLSIKEEKYFIKFTSRDLSTKPEFIRNWSFLHLTFGQMRERNLSGCIQCQARHHVAFIHICTYSFHVVWIKQSKSKYVSRVKHYRMIYLMHWLARRWYVPLFIGVCCCCCCCWLHRYVLLCVYICCDVDLCLVFGQHFIQSEKNKTRDRWRINVARLCWICILHSYICATQTHSHTCISQPTNDAFENAR